MAKKKEIIVKKERFWDKATFMAANDNTTVTIYRLANGVLGIVLLGMLSYFGNRLISASDKMNNDLTIATTKIEQLRTDIATLQAVNDMMNQRINRIADRMNVDENRITTLEARLDFILMRGR